MQEEFAVPPESNTGVTQRIDEGCEDLEVKAYIEATRDRGWLSGSIGATCPVSGYDPRLDGLTATLPANNFERCKKKLQELFETDEEFQEASYGTRWYQKCWPWLYGVSLHSEHRVASCSGHFKIDFLGHASERLESLERPDCRYEKWQELLRWLRDYGGHLTRIDGDYDDFRSYGTGDVTPTKMLEACEQLGYKPCKGVIGFNVYEYTKSSSRSGTGETIKFGKNGGDGSGKTYTCYDKGVESKGDRFCYRHELKLFDEKAREFFNYLCDAPIELWPQIIRGAVFGAIDFRDLAYYNTTFKHISHCPQLTWWEKFVSEDCPISFASKSKKHPTLNRAMRWLKKQVAPTLAMVLDCCSLRKEDGDALWLFFYNLWDLGEENMSLKHRQIIAEQKALLGIT